MQWELVEEWLAGQNVYFDLAYSIKRISRESLLRIMKKHGTDRILFATDFPWSSQKESAEFVKALPLLEDEIENIMFRNATRLLEL